MTYTFQVRRHPLGVVVYSDPGVVGELLIQGESCCGVAFEELQRLADTTGSVTVDESSACDCPLKRIKWAA